MWVALRANPFLGLLRFTSFGTDWPYAPAPLPTAVSAMLTERIWRYARATSAVRVRAAVRDRPDATAGGTATVPEPTDPPPDPAKPPDVEPAEPSTGGIVWSPRNDGSTAITVSGSVEPSTVKNHVGTKMFEPPAVVV